MGGLSVAHDFALGGVAHAVDANNDLATQFLQSEPFFRYGQIAARYAAWLNVIWLVPMLVWWQIVRRRTRARG